MTKMDEAVKAALDVAEGWMGVSVDVFNRALRERGYVVVPVNQIEWRCTHCGGVVKFDGGEAEVFGPYDQRAVKAIKIEGDEP